MMGWSAPTGIDDYADTAARRKAIDGCAGGASCEEVYPPPASKVDAAWAGMTGASRALILHELVHGLGFNIFEMQDIQEADGTKRQLVRRQEMADPDGTKDTVWLGFDRTVASETEAPSPSANLVWSEWAVVHSGGATEPHLRRARRRAAARPPR